MDSTISHCDCRRPAVTWTWTCCIAAALIFAFVVDGILVMSSQLFDGSWLSAGHQHFANTLRDENAGVVTAVAGSGANGGPRTRRGMQELVLEEGSENDTLVSRTTHTVQPG